MKTPLTVQFHIFLRRVSLYLRLALARLDVWQCIEYFGSYNELWWIAFITAWRITCSLLSVFVLWLQWSSKILLNSGISIFTLNGTERWKREWLGWIHNKGEIKKLMFWDGLKGKCFDRQGENGVNWDEGKNGVIQGKGEERWIFDSSETCVEVQIIPYNRMIRDKGKWLMVRVKKGKNWGLMLKCQPPKNSMGDFT